MRAVSTILEPAAWSLDDALDLAELLIRYIAHPDRRDDRLHYLVPGRLDVERARDGRVTAVEVLPRSEDGVPPGACVAPEVADGSRRPSFESDLYVVLAVLYEVLVGRPMPPYVRRANALEMRSLPGIDQLFHVGLDRSRRRAGVRPASCIDAIRIARAEARPRLTGLDIGQHTSLGGVPHKLSNQDATGVFVDTRTSDSWPEVRSLLVVCDGVGSTRDGGPMARRLVDACGDVFREQVAVHTFVEHGRRIEASARAVVSAAARRALADIECSGTSERFDGGSTVVAVLTIGDRASVAWVGDSRAYWLPADRNELVRLTADHSMTGAAHRAGRLEVDEADRGPWSSVITGVVSHTQRFRGIAHGVDGLSATLAEVEYIELSEGDQLLVTSDGLVGALRDESIVRGLRQATTSHRAAYDLVTSAIAHGESQDNYAVVVARPGFAPGVPLAPVGPPLRKR